MDPRAASIRTQLRPGDDEPPVPEPEEKPRGRRETGHPETQLRLAQTANRGELDVWIARNDRATTVNGTRLGDLSVEALPEGLPAEVRRTIELIDVVWLNRNRYIAAFEIEATTPIWTGLVRMGDLIASLPNLSIPLFIVAPESKRERVLSELTRPLFRYGLDPPLEEVCRFVSFEALQAAFEQYENARGLDPMRLIEEIAESAQ